MTTTIELIERVPPPATHPESLATLMAVMSDPTVSVEELEPIISCDTGLTAGLLRVCNSTYFSWSREIGTVREALVRVGNLTFARIAFVLCLEPALKNRLYGYRMEADDMWRHSLAVGYAASRLAAAFELPTLRERAFTAGVLHDIGKLALDEVVLEHRRGEDETSRRAVEFVDRHLERRLVGLDHAEIGGALLESWWLPADLVAAVRCHHAPEHAGKHMLLARLVYGANAILQTVEGRLSESEAAERRCELLEWDVPTVLLDELQETIAQAGNDMMSVIMARRR